MLSTGRFSKTSSYRGECSAEILHRPERLRRSFSRRWAAGGLRFPICTFAREIDEKCGVQELVPNRLLIPRQDRNGQEPTTSPAPFMLMLFMVNLPSVRSSERS